MSSLTQTRDHARTMARKGGADSPLWTQIEQVLSLCGPVEVLVDLVGGEVTAEPEPDPT